MFCTKCGAKLPEGSKFCMECGAKLEVPAPAVEEAPSANNWNEPIESIEEETVESVRPSVSFDWSTVKEESHKKEVPEVHSPWGTTGLNEKELFAEISTPSEDHSRTMSFIDILKKERDAKAQAAEEEARPVTEREEPEEDFSAFQEAPSFYVPPMYDDLEGTTVTPFDNLEPEMDDAEEIEEVEEVEIPFATSEAEEEELAITFDEPESPVVAEGEKYHTSSFDSPDLSATEDYSDLESSLAAILEAGAGKTVAEEEQVDLFGDVKESEGDEAVENFYLDDVEEDEPAFSIPSIEEPAVDIQIGEPMDIEESPAFEEPIVDFEEGYVSNFNEPIEIESEDDLDEEALEELEKLYISEDDFEEPEAELKELEIAEPEEEPETEVENVESEIEALKRRLAELMGEPEEPEEIAKEEASVEDIIEEKYYEEPFTDEYLTGDDEFEVELSDEEPEEVEEENITIEEAVDADEEFDDEDHEEAKADEAETDAVSLEELEKDLFGDAEIPEEPEATKKIDKFYTLYKKNEEFQKLLDEEYNKLQGEDKVPHVDDFVPVEVIKDEPVSEDFEEPELKRVEEALEETVEPAPVAEPAPSKEDAKAAKKAEKEAAKAAKAAAKAAKKAEKSEVSGDDEEEAGGGALTVIAVIIAALLVILLAVILVLNFAPDSGIAMKIDSVIETITSYFSATDAFNGRFLL